MRVTSNLLKLAAFPLLSALAACVPDTNGGYYDANGNYHAYGNAYPSDYRDSRTYNVAGYGAPATAQPYPYTFSRSGFYDYNGYYIGMDAGPQLPADFFPPRGMCRVWFPDRAATYQPPIEPCSGIQYRVPAGAYVVYGG